MSTAQLPNSSEVPAPFDAGWLDVGHGHRIRYECSGNPDGIPLVLLHGGPGSASSAAQRSFVDGARYRIVQFDQRGSGASTPLGSIEHNHTGALIDDIEALRRHLDIGRWVVSGGSWGSTLALVYAGAHRGAVRALIVRAVFLGDASDIDWYFGAAGALVPEAYERFADAIPRRWRRSIPAYLDRAFARRDASCERLALSWRSYELALSGTAEPMITPHADEIRRMIERYRVQAHYLARRCFLGKNAVIRAASTLRGVPVAIVHGDSDRMCRPRDAWRVHRAAAGSRLAWALGAGHDPFHPAMERLSRAAFVRLAEDGDFARWPVDAP